MRRRVRACCALAAMFIWVAAPAQLAPLGNVAPPADAQGRATLPQSLPLLRDTPPAAETAGWKSTWLLLALAGAAGGWWLWRRLPGPTLRQRTREPGAVVRLSSQPLTPQASVHAVQWRGEEFLIACTGQQVTLLSRSPVVVPQETP